MSRQSPGIDYHRIYAQHASEYDELVRAEDCDHNLIPEIEAIHPFKGGAVLEVGIGTARIAAELVGGTHRFLGIDRSTAMLAIAQRNLCAIGAESRWNLVCADATALPVTAAWADMAVAGWVLGHFREWMPERWTDEIDSALGELRRAVRPGGTLVVIESLGTGRSEPAAPNEALVEYHVWLEHVHGFRRRTIRTDYLFHDWQTAVRCIRFFFGDDLAALVRRKRWRRVPEFTGVWWSRR